MWEASISNWLRQSGISRKPAKEKNISSEIILAARYVICAALDEAVLKTPWGAESAWTQRTLLSTFHSETHGGEKFFLLLDKMKERPAQNLDMLELMYVFLSLGFEGKYHLNPRGREILEKIRDELFQIIRTFRGEYERALSPRWQGLGRTKNTLAHLCTAVGRCQCSGGEYWC